VPSTQRLDLSDVLAISGVLAPIRLGADFAPHCSEMEQFDDRDSSRAKIWIFDCLIYDRKKSAARANDPNRATTKRKSLSSDSGRSD
jgi:hypothetical protein